MIQQEYIMLIMNCKKYAEKAQFQKNTWLRKIPEYLQYYHVIGEPELDTNYKFDNEKRVLWVKVEDDYNSLPKKVVRAYQAVFETFDFKYIFKTDDDQNLINEKFFDVVKGITGNNSNSNNNINNNNNSKKIHYGGYIVDVKHNYLSQYHKIHPELPEYLPIFQTKYCSGRFYFLSRQAISNIISKKQFIEKEYLEDYAIGFNLDQYYKLNMINLATNNFFKDIDLSDYSTLLEEGKT
jgi:hypothetical protein